MPYISVSNVRVEEVAVERNDGEFCVVNLLESGSRIMIRKSRMYGNKEELEQKIGLKQVRTSRTPADYFH